MKKIDSIHERRSIRKFSSKPISRSTIEELIYAAGQAPSAKNRQPWHFYIINGELEKNDFVNAIEQGIDHCEKANNSNGIMRADIVAAHSSIEVMRQSPVLIIVTHKRKYAIIHEDGVDWNLSAKDIEVTDMLSIGASIQNMLLVATENDIGSLWICDFFYAYKATREYLCTDDSIVSIICLGYSLENPSPRPRENVASITSWL